jgi:arylsulfatase B/arylsulfatase I/J
MGMTSWGCTPTCRGFDHFFGFYNAFNDYFTHMVGAGLDLRNDTTPVTNMNGAVRVFRQKFTLDDAIGSHAFSLESSCMHATNGIPLGCSLLLPVHTVNSV